MPNDAWSAWEVELIVHDYFEMLRKELRGKPYIKTAHRKALALQLPRRSKGSIEFKHQNISAILAKHNHLYIKGYQPGFYSFQRLLEDTVLSYLSKNSQILTEFDRFVEAPPDLPLGQVPFDRWRVDPPEAKGVKEKETPYRSRAKSQRNYLEEEQRNQAIGQRGEQLVYDYEIWRLQNSLQSHLAKQVRWISQEDDGAGYDILSKETDGTDRYIEVKSTTLGKETPIFFSQNENAFSKVHAEHFYLYRVFDLRKKPKLFIQQGSFESYCRMEVVSYKGWF